MGQTLLRSTAFGSFLVAVLLADMKAVPAAGSAAKFMADAAFVDSVDCKSTDVFVAVQRGNLDTDKRGKYGSVTLKIFRTDDCEDTTLLNAQVKTDLDFNDLRYDSNLNTATLKTSIEMENEITDEPFIVAAHLTWEGVEDADIMDTNIDRQLSGEAIVRPEVYRKKYRNATAHGTISDGVSEYVPESAEEASMTLYLKIK